MPKEMKEERLYATRFWNNEDEYAGITEFGKMDLSYEKFQEMSLKYDNVEWVERITHVISAKGTQACNHEESERNNQ